jgi:diguanylate cyclase (GGDEF)-like protein
MRPPLRYAAWGALLGLGAPLGSLLLRGLLAAEQGIWPAMIREFQTAAYYYAYMTLGTILAFGSFGYALGRRNDRLSDLSIKDGLTGVYNHRYLQEQLAHEVERSDRYAIPVTCLLIDIDDFKNVNDQYGHLSGDAVLGEVARVIRNGVRKIDIVGRYGGEEFLVIMPDTDTQAAEPIARRIVTMMREHAFVLAGFLSLRVTVSIGLATYPFLEDGVKSKNALLSAADQAMYRAKRSGKNKTVIWHA